MIRSWPLFLLVAALAGLRTPGERTLLTKSGEAVTGTVTQAGDVYRVDSPAGSRTFRASEVGCVFEDPHEIVVLAAARFQEAKRIYGEAEHLPDADRGRNEKILAAIDLAQGASQLLNLVQPHSSTADRGAILRDLPIVLQFLRLCRGAATSEAARSTEAPAVKPLALADARFAFQPPPAADRPWILKGELGPGLATLAQDLFNPDPARRLDAVQRLSHPPAATQLPALLKVLEGERDPAILQVLGESLAWQEPSAVLKSMGWAKKDPDPARRAIAFAVARAASDRSAFDYLLDWFAETPPVKHDDRAAFGAAFRQYHAWSTPQLKDLLSKQRNPRLQTEILRQMGAIGDKAAAPMLVKAIATYPRDAAVSLLKIGKPALPTIIEGCHSDEQNTRRICLAICRKLTGVNSLNAGTFETWWAGNKKQVADEEKTWWEEQAKHAFAVLPAFFAPYDLPLEASVN
jgi:hypothetical protein